jgi:hypothetical protein
VMEKKRQAMIGEPLHLWVQLFDNREDMDVFAVLHSDERLNIESIRLVHKANGFYDSNDLIMPETEKIVVQYQVTKDRQQIDEYEAVAEVIEGIPRPEPEEKFVEGRAIIRTKERGVIIGRCQSKRMRGRNEI